MRLGRESLYVMLFVCFWVRGWWMNEELVIGLVWAILISVGVFPEWEYHFSFLLFSVAARRVALHSVVIFLLTAISQKNSLMRIREILVTYVFLLISGVVLLIWYWVWFLIQGPGGFYKKNCFPIHCHLSVNCNCLEEFSF